jgi:hypothetical protein
LAQAATPALSVSPAKLAFAYANGVVPAAQNVTITNTGGGTLQWTAASSATWLSVSAASGTGSALQVSVNPVNLAPTTYTGRVTITAAGASGSPQTISVTLSVPSPRLTLSAKEVAMAIGTTGTGAATIGISNTGGSKFTWTAASSVGWLQVSAASGTAPAQLQLVANLTGFAAGTYGGAVTIRAPGAEQSPAYISVKATVAAKSGTGSGTDSGSGSGTTTASLNAVPSSLRFSMTAGGTAPAAQAIAISNSKSSAATWTAAANQPWIHLGQTSGSMPASLPVSITGASLAEGTYTGAVAITSSALSGSPMSIPVTLTVAAKTPTSSAAGEFYVSPSGSPSGNGSISNPWDLKTALAHPAAVKPGSTIWLRGGHYVGTFVSKLVGTRDKPIIVRQYPDERATIDTSTYTSDAGILANGSDTWFWGFEIMSSNPVRTTGVSGSWSAPGRVDGIDTYGPRNKYINLVVHDTAQGFGYWTPAVDNEIYGCLIYYNGWSGPDRGHGHGVYSQNLDGTKTIADNIQFLGFGMGLRAYGSENAYAKNIHFLGNISFNSGYLAGGPGSHWSNYLVTVGSGAEGIIFNDNHSYHNTNEDGYTQLGWSFSGIEKDLVAKNNYFIGGEAATEVWNWNKLTFTGNTMYSKSDFMLKLSHRSDQSLSNYTFDRNTYWGSGLLRSQSTNSNWTNWAKVAGVDANSTFHAGRPTGVWTTVRPNKYEEGRANIVIYNWDLKPSVTVDVSGVLTVGQAYEVRDVLNFYGTPVASGVYGGSAISIPMTGLTIAPPVGNVPYTPKHTAPEFGTFVLLGK